MRSKTIVLKFGGTSVGSIERIKIVSKIILSHKSKNTRVAVISSAMSGVTNELIKKTKSISNNFDSAEYDTLLSTCLLYTSPSPRDATLSRMPSSA